MGLEVMSNVVHSVVPEWYEACFTMVKGESREVSEFMKRLAQYGDVQLGILKDYSGIVRKRSGDTVWDYPRNAT